VLSEHYSGREWLVPYYIDRDIGVIVHKYDAHSRPKTPKWRTMDFKKDDITPFEISNYLLCEADIVIYLEMLLTEADPKEINFAIEQVKRARRNMQTAKRIVGPRSNIEALLKVLRKLGFLLMLEQGYAQAT
jgi:DNA-binding phage protein